MQRRITLLLALAGAAAAGCSSSSDTPHGSPKLVQAFWIAAGQPLLIWQNPDASLVPDADFGAVVTTVPPGAKQIDLVFDRLIDGNTVEDTVNTTAGSVQQQKDDRPVIVDWPGRAEASSTPPYYLDVWYNSQSLALASGAEKAGSSYVYLREGPSYPSATPLTITFVRDGQGADGGDGPTRIRGKYGDSLAVPGSDPAGLPPITVTTAPFSLSFVGGAGQAVAVNYWLSMQFNTVPGDLTALFPHVHVTSAGTALPFQLQSEPTDPTRIYVQPVTGQVWPSGATVEVNVDADLPDAFGAKLGAAQTTTFQPCHPADGGAGCLPPADGGAPAADAGGGFDGGADDAAEAGTDSGGTIDDAGASADDAGSD